MTPTDPHRMAPGLVAFAGLDAAHRDGVRLVYETSFPAALRAPWADLVSARPDEQLMVLLDEGDRGAPPAGMVLVRHLGSTEHTFLRYFVVDAERRGRGHGAALWQALVAHLRAAERGTLLLDVEDPTARVEGSAEQRDDLRRIEFYRRQGAHVLAVHGYAPPDHGLAGETPHLLLMGAALHAEATPSCPLGPSPEGEALRAAVVAVYEHRYGLPADHATVRTTLLRSGLVGPG